MLWRYMTFLFLGMGLLTGCAATSETAITDATAQQLARELLEELIEIDTTDTGDTTRAAEAMAERLRQAGLEDVRVLSPHPKKGNLVVRLSGTGERAPILLLAHLDVVPAHREDWSFDPFELRELDGFLYGRGVMDDKAMAAIWIANLIRYHAEGFLPSRDLIVALTSDEEGGDHNGVRWLLENHRDLIEAELCLNEGGGGQMRNGTPLLNRVQATEKMYLSFRLSVRNPRGHSSLPVPDNAIYRLSRGLTRLADFVFPARLNEVTRSYFARMAAFESGRTASDMRAVARVPPDPAAVARLTHIAYYNALMRTTCVATELEAGHAENALPQNAEATVNCRLLPDEDPEVVRQTLVEVLADDAIEVVPMGKARPSPPSPLRREILEPIERVTAALWPGAAVVPVMSTGATDGLYLRRAGIPTYGVSGIFADVGDDRAHGRDERVGVRSFYQGQEFLYRLVKDLAPIRRKTRRSRK